MKTDDPRLVRVSATAWGIACAIAAVLLLIAISPNTPTYYAYLRWFTFILAGASVWASIYTTKGPGAFPAFFIICIIFNPISPFNFEKSRWQIIDACTGIFFICGAVFLRWDSENQLILRGRAIIERGLRSAVLGCLCLLAVGVVVPLLLMPISYLFRGDESIVDIWYNLPRFSPYVFVPILVVLTAYLFRRFTREERKLKTSLPAGSDSPIEASSAAALVKPSVRENIKAALWVIAGIVMVLCILKYTVEVFHVMHGGAKAVAHVVDTYDDYRESDDGRRAAYVTVATYEFVAKGRDFKGKTEGQQGSWSKGDKLDVEFYPADPNKNRAAGDRDSLGKLFMLVLLGGVFAYYAIKVNMPVLLGRPGPRDDS